MRRFVALNIRQGPTQYNCKRGVKLSWVEYGENSRFPGRSQCAPRVGSAASRVALAACSGPLARLRERQSFSTPHRERWGWSGGWSGGWLGERPRAAESFERRAESAGRTVFSRFSRFSRRRLHQRRKGWKATGAIRAYETFIFFNFDDF